MKRLLCMLFSVVFTGMLFAQVGFIDHEGYVVIEPKYKSALPFSEGVAVVETFKGYKQFIDANGNVVIKMKFLDAKSFREGLAPVMESKEKGWGYINKQGKYVIAPNPKITYVDPFSEGLSMIVEESTTKYIRRDGSVHLITSGGRSFSEGYAVTGILIKDANGKEKAKRGFIDKFGKWVIEPKYDIAFSFSEGLAMVGMEDENGNKTIQFIEPSGSVRIEFPKKFSPNATGLYIDTREEVLFREGFAFIWMNEIFPESDTELKVQEAFYESHKFYLHDPEGTYGLSKSGIFISYPPFEDRYKFFQSEGTIAGHVGFYNFFTSEMYMIGFRQHFLVHGNILKSPFIEGYAVFQVDQCPLEKISSLKLAKQYTKGKNIFTQNHYTVIKPNILPRYIFQGGKWNKWIPEEDIKR